jgi:hypothetical protein
MNRSRSQLGGGNLVLVVRGVYSRAAHTDERVQQAVERVDSMVPCHELEFFAGRCTKVGCGPQSWSGSFLDRHSSDGSDGGTGGTGVHNGTSSRHRYGVALLRRAHIGPGWHRSSNIFFDYGP